MTSVHLFNGKRRDSRPGFVDLRNAENETFKKLVGLMDKGEWDAVVAEADAAIARSPEWLTPYLHKAIALINTGRVREGIPLLEHVERESAGLDGDTGGHPGYTQATKLLAQARALLK